MKLSTSSNEIGLALHHAFSERETFTLTGNGFSANYVATELNSEPSALNYNRRTVSLNLQQVSEISQVKPWAGEGHPPVGTVCEWHPNVHGWVEVTILGRDGDCTWYRVKGEEASQTCRHMAFFRPIRAPEQIAEEEREKYVQIAMDDTRTLGISDTSKRILIERLYDSGHRK